MANTQKNLKEFQNLFLTAKEKMEAKRKTPPKIDAPVEMKVETLNRLKQRIVSLNEAKLEAIKEFDAQIKTQKIRIGALEKEIQEDKKKLSQIDTNKKITTTKKKTVKKVVKKK